jgi:MarR family transcriptional regulator for hemolysin
MQTRRAQDTRADLGFKLIYVARQYRAALDRAVAEFGLSDALTLPILTLARHPQGMRQNAMADAVGVEGPSLVRLIDRLVADGLVDRQEDQIDRRAKILTLTKAGHALCRPIMATLDEFRAAAMDGISPDDLAACLRVFLSMEQRLSDMRRVPASLRP